MNPESHPLDKHYDYWFSTSNPKKFTDYEETIKAIATFTTVEEFWQVYSHLRKPDDIPLNTEYFVFQKGIKPMWEDEANKRGGRFMLRIKKGAASVFWEELLLAMIGEQFEVNDEICGVSVSVRAKEDTFAVWIRTAGDFSVKNSVKATLQRIWALSEKVHIDFREHPTQAKYPKSKFTPPAEPTPS